MRMWVGKILKYFNKWKLEKLGNVCEMGSGGTPLKIHQEYYGGNVKWAIIGDLNEGIIYDTEKTISEKGLKESSAKLVPKGTLLVGMYGSIGKTAITGCEMATNQAIAFLIPKKDLVNLHYLKYFIQFINSELFKLSKGQTQKNISQEILREINIPLPTIKEQQLIISEIEKQFSRLDEATKSLKSLKTKLETYKKSVLKIAFENKDFPKTLLGEIVISINSGYACGKHTKDDRGLLHFRPYNINSDGNIDFTLGKFVDSAFSPKRLSKGDVIFNNTNSSELVGKTCYYDENREAGFSNHMTQIKVNKSKANAKFIAKYLHFLFLTGYYKKIMKSHVNQSSVNIDQLQKIKVPLPDLNIQKKVLENLEKSASLIDRVQKSIEMIMGKNEQLRKSILKSAFEGKLVK